MKRNKNRTPETLDVSFETAGEGTRFDVSIGSAEVEGASASGAAPGGLIKTSIVQTVQSDIVSARGPESVIDLSPSFRTAA